MQNSATKKSQSDKKKVYVLSSTHWDREWYQAFEHYRARLVRMVDNLLDVLEKDSEFKHFHFDGQTIFIKDYLKIRPENRDRLYNLIKSGRILIGPWYTMPDEFLISGEAMVRNLQKGGQICTQLGVEANKNGYICDIFGHNSQMPQIFDGFSLKATALFRGRADYENNNFLWKGADGTQIITHKLHPDYSYSDFFFVVRWPYRDGGEYDDKDVIRRVKMCLDAEEKYMVADCHLMIDGVDHGDIESHTPSFIKLLNDNIEGYEFIHSNFEDYASEVSKRLDKLEVVEGAIYDVTREGVNNALLKNVLSSLVKLKQANDFCESGLSLKTEVMDYYINSVKDKALASGRKGMLPYDGFLDTAWEYVLQNQAHDSICGCSISAVHLDNENRFKRAKEIMQFVDSDIACYLSQSIAYNGKGKDGALTVFNNTQSKINGTTEVTFEIAENMHQRNFRFFDKNGNEVKHSIVAHERYSKRVHEYSKLVTFPKFDRFTLAMSLEVEPYSYTSLTYDILKTERHYKDSNWKTDRFDGANRYLGSMRTSVNTVDNGALVVTINPNATIDVLDKQSGKLYQNLLMAEDCGDRGDGWNYGKPFADEESVSICNASEYKVLKDCPEYFSFKLIQRLTLPQRYDFFGKSADYGECMVEHLVKLFKNSKKISITTRVDNKQLNHRLRIVFPTNLATQKFKTLLPFDMYEWDIKKADYSFTKEFDSEVNPNQGAISITDGRNMFSVYNKGLYEVAVLDRADRAVYLTLFRSFTREIGENEGNLGKMLGENIFEYMMDFEFNSNSQIVKNANAFKTGIVSFSTINSTAQSPITTADYGTAVRHNLDGALDSCSTFLTISGGAVLSALRYGRKIDDEVATIIRIYDVDGHSEGKISFDKNVLKVFETNLAENTVLSQVKTQKNSFDYKLGKKQIKTYAVVFSD